MQGTLFIQECADLLALDRTGWKTSMRLTLNSADGIPQVLLDMLHTCMDIAVRNARRANMVGIDDAESDAAGCPGAAHLFWGQNLPVCLPSAGWLLLVKQCQPPVTG